MHTQDSASKEFYLNNFKNRIFLFFQYGMMELVYKSMDNAYGYL